MEHEPLAVGMDDLMKMTGLGRSTINKAVADGSLKARQNGRRRLYLMEDVRSWLENLPRG